MASSASSGSVRCSSASSTTLIRRVSTRLTTNAGASATSTGRLRSFSAKLQAVASVSSSVCGEHAVLAHVLAQLAEDLLLDLTLLEDGLEHQVAVGEVLVAGGGGDERAEEPRLAFVVATLR